MSTKHGRKRQPKKRRVKGGTADADDLGLSDDEWGDIVRAHYRRRRRQKIWGAILAGAGLVVILNHFLEHTDAVDVLGPLLSSSAQDVVAGFPVGALLIVAAVFLFGQLDDPPDRAVVARQRRAG